MQRQKMSDTAPIGASRAEAVAIKALHFIAEDRAELDRFMALTGVTPGELRAAASNPGFLVGVLDYLLGHEPTLLRFTESRRLPPEVVTEARQVLAGPEDIVW